MADAPIVFARSGAFVAEPASTIDDAQIYVLNDRRSLAARILESSGVAILTVDEAADTNSRYRSGPAGRAVTAAFRPMLAAGRGRG